MLHYTELKDTVFGLASIKDIDQYIIISGFVGVLPIQQLADQASDLKITLIYGMYGEAKISESLHKELLQVQLQHPNIEILYSKKPVHSKIYFVRKGTKIKNALVGSANFSVAGMQNFREVLADADVESFGNFSRYYNWVLKNSISCKSDLISFTKGGKLRLIEEQPEKEHGICKISLLGRGQKVQGKAGLNWGLSKGHVNEGDAYLKIARSYLSDFPELFPPKNIQDSKHPSKKADNDEIELIWDDGKKMIGLLEGTQTIIVDGKSVAYPKQLSSRPSKSVLGKYLRERLGCSLSHKITKQDLLNYGRTDIDIKLIGFGVYKLDFSVNNN